MDLKVIERLQQIGWKQGVGRYFALSAGECFHQKIFDWGKSIKQHITLTDINGNILQFYNLNSLK